jgi:hypothetical protein
MKLFKRFILLFLLGTALANAVALACEKNDIKVFIARVKAKNEPVKEMAPQFPLTTLLNF